MYCRLNMNNTEKNKKQFRAKIFFNIAEELLIIQY